MAFWLIAAVIIVPEKFNYNTKKAIVEVFF